MRRIEFGEAEDDPVIKTLLTLAVEPDRVQRVLALTFRHGACLVAVEQAQIVGCLCLSKAGGAPDAVIEAIAVDPSRQGHGIGRRLVEYAVTEHLAASLQAETDHASVGFYRRLGFQVTSLGEKYPGVERFICCIQIQDPSLPAR